MYDVTVDTMETLVDQAYKDVVDDVDQAYKDVVDHMHVKVNKMKTVLETLRMKTTMMIMMMMMTMCMMS